MIDRQLTSAGLGTAVALLIVALLSGLSWADEYDPPASYYSTALGTGSVLKSALHNIIDDHTTRSYDQIRTDLQVTDAVPGDPTKIYVVYNNRVPITKPTGGSIPGWDNGVTWNREHSWPQARGVDATSAPDGSDMHHVFPSKPSDNSLRDNRNFAGAYGAQGRGLVNVGGGEDAYYPGDLDAGFIARAQFYMAVRYDGMESGTSNLELVAGNPTSGGTTMGDVNRLIEWHFAAPPDTFERRRNEVIYDSYQHNRNPFIDRPEFAWSIFVDQANDSRIAIDGMAVDLNGVTTRNVDLGRVFKNSAVPSAQSFTLNKSGMDGTYFEVTASGAATSSINGRFNAFRTNQTDSKSISVGLNTDTTTVGLRSGTVTVNNLDVTTAGGTGRGSFDADDTFNVSLTVLDHAIPSFASEKTVTSLLHDFGTITTASIGAVFPFQVFNRGLSPEFTATMDLDNVLAFSDGDGTVFSLLPAGAAGILQVPGGASSNFTTQIMPTSVGSFSATYTLRFSDEDIPGAENNKDITLSLTGTVVLAGDFNREGAVDTSDYLVWRKTNGSNATAFSGADADGSGVVDATDLGWWKQNFGMFATPGGSGRSVVPEPEASAMLVALAAAWRTKRRR
jgi:endonuclease I